MKRKYEVVNAIARRYGCTSYLEICTPMTGLAYARVDRGQLKRLTRLMYCCPTGYDDGKPIDLRTEAPSAESLFAELQGTGQRFDLVFVDSAHDYANTARDLAFGLQVTAAGGTVVIHDCNPENAMLAHPAYQPGPWCGVTYAAFLDLVLATEELSYVTVDTDFGCGIISRGKRWNRFSKSRIDPSLATGWVSLALSEKFPFFDQNRKKLLRLVSPERFERHLARPDSEAWNWLVRKLRRPAGPAS